MSDRHADPIRPSFTQGLAVHFGTKIPLPIANPALRSASNPHLVGPVASSEAAGLFLLKAMYALCRDYFPPALHWRKLPVQFGGRVHDDLSASFGMPA